jgi:sporulation protein YunB
MNAAVEDVLIDEKVDYAKLVKVTTATNGLRSLETDAVEVTMIKGKINEAVVKAIAKSDAKIKLPLGSLLGSELFAGLGPTITVRLKMSAHASSTVNSELVSSGLNQTMHRISLPLNVDLRVILSKEVLSTEISTTVVLADTVIIGDVPSGLLTGG